MSLERVETGDDLVFWAPADADNVIFSTRTGGTSAGPFLSLNVSDAVGDSAEHVKLNRRTISGALGISDDWCLPRQVHGSEVIDASRFGGDSPPEADAVVASSAGRPIAVVTADCLPIALTGPAFRGVVHAGWRGLSAGVIDRALERSIFAPSSIRAWIGPSIGPCHYVVGAEVPAAFLAKYPGAPQFGIHDGDALHFDLRGAARWVLRRWGVQVGEYEPPCTFCDRSLFSYRRDGQTGRQAVIVS